MENLTTNLWKVGRMAEIGQGFQYGLHQMVDQQIPSNGANGRLGLGQHPNLPKKTASCRV